MTSSPTLWWALALHGTGLLAALSLATLPLLVWTQRSRLAHPSELHRDEGGTAAAVDFVLTLPIFMTFVSLAVQFAVLLNATLVVHYAAYSAARSARVWVAEAQATSPIPAIPLPIAMPVGPEVQQRAEAAARMALVSISPADAAITSGAAAVPARTLRNLAAQAGLAPRGDAFVTKARYAFDPRNTTVTVKTRWQNGAPRAEATVSYQIHTGILAGRYLGADRGDGVRALSARATVDLQ